MTKYYTCRDGLHRRKVNVPVMLTADEHEQLTRLWKAFNEMVSKPNRLTLKEYLAMELKNRCSDIQAELDEELADQEAGSHTASQQVRRCDVCKLGVDDLIRTEEGWRKRHWIGETTCSECS